LKGGSEPLGSENLKGLKGGSEPLGSENLKVGSEPLVLITFYQ